jgi:hypothetical protein
MGKRRRRKEKEEGKGKEKGDGERKGRKGENTRKIKGLKVIEFYMGITILDIVK